MPNPNEAREEAWRAFTDEYTRWAARGIDEPIEFDYAWVARGRYDEQRIAELERELAAANTLLKTTLAFPERLRDELAASKAKFTPYVDLSVMPRVEASDD